MMKRTDDVRAAIAALSGIPPIDYTQAIEQQRETDRRKRDAWEQAEKAAAEPYKIVKRYVRSRLKLGKFQNIAFHGQGITAYFANPKWHQVCTIHATIATGINGVKLTIEWRPEDLIDLDRKLAAVRDMLAAARME